jgi:transposase-like protein
MRVEGTCGAGGATNLTGVPVPTRAVPSGRTILDDLARKHARTPTITLSAEPQEITPKPQAKVKRPGAVGQRTSDVRWLTDHEKARVTELYKAGRTITQIADELGRYKTTIRRHIDASGIPKRNDRGDVTPEVRGAIIARYQDGETAASIARAVGVNAATVTRQLRAAGQVPPAERRRKETAA